MINFQSQFSFLEIKDSQQNFWSTSPLPILNINLQQFQSMNIIKFGKKLSKKFSLIDNYLIQFGSNYKWINLINVTIELINDKNAGLGVKLIKKGRSFIFFGDVINWYEQMKQYCILKNFYENYHLSKQIGQGSSARVYAAYSKFQLSHSQIFAVKCIQKEHQEALIKEIGILRALNHECIIKIHEVYEEVDFVYLVQEYWPGGNLNNIKLAEQKCIKIILQLLRAIAYLHSKGIMHRDIKPKNILFKDQSFSKVCLADFGLADYYNENGKYMYEKCGTPGFMAPELLNEKMYDYKVDIYSIGILMYYLITGKSPFYGQNQEEIMNNNYQGKINYQDAKISETGMDLLRKLLHNDPLQRLSADVAIKHEWFKQEGILNHFKIRQQSLQSSQLKENLGFKFKFKLILKLSLQQIRKISFVRQCSHFQQEQSITQDSQEIFVQWQMINISLCCQFIMLKKIRKTVRVFDVFAAPIVFNFNGQESYKSFTGGISTLIVIFLIIVTFQSQIRVFSNKETIFFETTSDFKQDPQSLQLSNSKFLFAIRIEQTTNFAKNPFFAINATQQYYATKNGTTSRSVSEIYFEPCRLERFEQMDPILSKSFLDNNLSEYLCPTQDSFMHLKGAYLSDQFDFIKFSVQNCTGYTNQLKLESYLEDNGQYRLVLYTTNYVVNPTKPKNYYELYLAEDLNFLFQPQLKQVVNVFFRNYEVSTDQSLFLNTDLVEESFIYRNERTYKVETVLDLQLSSSPITIYFRSDFFNEMAERRFQKIDQLFAYFGGIFNVFFLIFGIFVKQYNSTNKNGYIFYKMKMANKLYQFPDLQKKNTISKHINQQDVLVESVKNKQVQMMDINNQQLLQEHGYRNKVEFWYTYFKKVVIRQLSLYPSLQYILFIGTFRKKFVNESNLLLDRSLEYINADTNVRIMIKKIQEIEKLKNIFFSEAQLELFNFMQRPQITLKEHVSDMEIIKSQKMKGMEHFQQLLEAYRYLIENPSPNPEIQLTTIRLIQSIGKEMEQILQAAIAERQAGNQQIKQLETLNQ